MDYLRHMESIEVNGDKMAYAKHGKGLPMVFVHGIPTSSYLWRKILPVLSESAECYAPDLIGMGQSDKPDISYSIVDHYDYFKKWVEALDLKNITLVVHGWGSVVGLYYASQHPENIASIAFYESHLRPVTSKDMLSLPVQELVYMLGDEEKARKKIIQENYLIERLLPDAMVSNFTTKEMAAYREPFMTEASRAPLLQYFKELPLGVNETPALEMIQCYSKFLQTSQHPKCLLYAVPGLITPIETVAWAEDHLPNLTLCELGQALHYAQESHPRIFSQHLKAWYDEEVLSYLREGVS